MSANRHNIITLSTRATVFIGSCHHCYLVHVRTDYLFHVLFLIIFTCLLLPDIKSHIFCYSVLKQLTIP